MATVKFYLTRPQSDKPTAIYFLLNYGAFTIQPNGKKKYLPLKYYTNESILPEKWDAKAGALWRSEYLQEQYYAQVPHGN